MTTSAITIGADETPEVEAFLLERIYEFNAGATGYFDAEPFCGTHRDESGVIRAGISGYTWGGCCHVSYLWVDERERGHGLGAALLLAAEQHARAKGCVVVLLSSHSFQAPGFYQRMGYERKAVVHDHPVGHSSVYLAKRLEVL
jgi:GNAT superfamily N-acetyltransferase